MSQVRSSDFDLEEKMARMMLQAQVDTEKYEVCLPVLCWKSADAIVLFIISFFLSYLLPPGIDSEPRER